MNKTVSTESAYEQVVIDRRCLSMLVGVVMNVDAGVVMNFAYMPHVMNFAYMPHHELCLYA